MPTLVSARCWLHSQRESVARCPDCLQAYCRECITEHEGRVICAACLSQLRPSARRAGTRFTDWLRPGHVLVGWLVGWFLFYTLGRILLEIPSEWHESDQAVKWLTR